MDLARPYGALSPSIESDVLVALAASTTRRTGREIARMSERSVTGVQRALDRLVDEGLVHREGAGRAYLYSLNREHLLTPAVELMAGARWELVERLRAEIGRWSIPTFHASFFGSGARGEGNSRSDIDLLVVRKNGIGSEEAVWRKQLDELAVQVWKWTGNHASLIELSEADLSRFREDRPPVVGALEHEGINLAGVPVRELIQAVK